MGCANILDREHEPTMEEVVEYLGDAKDKWSELIAFINDNYNAAPKLTYSKCSLKPGWNVKFHKSGKSLCTLYPDKGLITALVVLGQKESDQINSNINSFGKYFIDVFKKAGALNGCKWLMLEINDKDVLEDIKKALLLKVSPKKVKNYAR